MIAAHSAFLSMSASDDFCTLRILPRIGSSAWNSESRASWAVPRAASPPPPNSTLRPSADRPSTSWAGRLELASPRKGQDKYIYTYSEAELRRTLIGLESKNQRFKEPPQRYKGLGEMDAKQLADTTMDPRHRTLRRIRMEDGAAAQGVFNLLMGTDVAPRRDFIVNGAAELDLSRIDT